MEIENRLDPKIKLFLIFLTLIILYLIFIQNVDIKDLSINPIPCREKIYDYLRGTKTTTFQITKITLKNQKKMFMSINIIHIELEKSQNIPARNRVKLN